MSQARQLPPPPTLKTDRLTIRPLRTDDAPQVHRLAGDFRVADTVASIPHPYSIHDARMFIQQSSEQIRSGQRYTLAIEKQPDHFLIGAITIGVDRQRSIGILGYWIGVPWWGNGYATEAARAMIAWAFAALPLREIHASYLRRNPASGRVMRKLGMWHWRSTRDIVRGVDEAVEHYVISADDLDRQSSD